MCPPRYPADLSGSRQQDHQRRPASRGRQSYRHLHGGEPCAMTMVVLLPWAPATSSSAQPGPGARSVVGGACQDEDGRIAQPLARWRRAASDPRVAVLPADDLVAAGNVAMRSCAEASAADSISAIGTSVACLTGRGPRCSWMLALRSSSCDTTPMADRSSSMRSLVMSTPSRVMVPALGS